MKRRRWLCWLAIVGGPALAAEGRLAPRFKPGQSLVYRVDFGSSRETRTESRVVVPQGSPISRLSAAILLQVRVVEVGAGGARLETYVSEDPRASGQPAGGGAAPDKRVDVLLGPDGRTSEIRGLEALSAAQQFAWNGWLARFASSLTYPKALRPGQRWEGSEPETAPAPIAGLKWHKRYRYVRDEPCRPGEGAARQPAAESCAVVFVEATLRQTSSPKNSTPPDFKLQNLTTRGVASGQNQTVLYIAKSTGLLVRSSEDAQQAMKVMVALADGSNEVRYDMSARSHSQVELLPDAPEEVR